MKKLFVVLLGLASLNVYTNGCGGEYQPAAGTCRIIDSSGRRILYNVGRPQSFNNGSVQSQPSVVNIDVPSRYDAWAINLKTGISADAMNVPSLEITRKGAIKACEQNGKNAPCKVKAWVRSGCLAAAKGKLNGQWISFPRSEAPGLVEDKALKTCQTSGYSQCAIAVPGGCLLPKFQQPHEPSVIQAAFSITAKPIQKLNFHIKQSIIEKPLISLALLLIIVIISV